MDFIPFKRAIAAQWERMQAHQLFRVEIGSHALWEAYLAAFPAGTNPIYRERTEHDCNCCRQFIRAVGNVVAVIDGELTSIWDIDGAEVDPGYRTVAWVMARQVESMPIVDAFLHDERTAGTDKNFEEVVGGRPMTWNHFFVNIDKRFVLPRKQIPTRLNELRGDRDVLIRSLREFKVEDVDTVLDLIAQNSLYRGAEHKATLESFRKLQQQWLDLDEPDYFVWTAEAHGAVKRIRNTSIGTLLQDLAAGKDLESAVKAYEKVVAPANYKRPKALVTPAMVAKAKEQVESLGLTSALERRYATLRDITINNLLFADRSTRKALGGDPFDDLLVGKRVKPGTLDRVEEMPVEKFLANVLPGAESIEVLLESGHLGNFVSLIAPADPTAKNLFKWPNRFSWSYTGDVADAIKERVKQAGGNVTGDLCCRLAWNNYDDLDLHLFMPNDGHVGFMCKRPFGSRGPQLDVDMNAGGGQTRDPVENIFVSARRDLPDGTYSLRVNQYRQRETEDTGFQVEIDYMGDVHSFVYDRSMHTDAWVEVARFRHTHADGLQWLPGGLPRGGGGRTAWGVSTNTFHPVKAIMLSPNYWDGNGVGNKHYFFMLEGCQNDGTARGFYNEFLTGDLEQHRKVLEMVGAKMRTEESAEQLSGLGFSSTAKNTLTCRVKGSFTRTIKVVF